MSDSDILRKLEEMERTGAGAGMIERQVRVVVWFYPWAVRDDLASRKEGRTIYHDAPYCARRAIGDKDYISGPATPAMIAEYPQEWARYQGAMTSPKSSIRYLPGAEIKPSILKYCEDAGFFAIEDLATAAEVQPELEGAKLLAQRWVAMARDMAVPAPVAKKRGGRVKGSKNRPKGPAHAEDAKTAA